MLNAIDLYEKLGMKNVCYKQSSNPNTLDSLFFMIVDKNCPVDCYASRRAADGKTTRHCFNVDGWLRLQYTQSIRELISIDGQPILRDDKEQRRFDLLHINLGWSGSCDGYYLPGAFDLASTEFSEYDEENDGGGAKQRNNNLNVQYVMYEL